MPGSVPTHFISEPLFPLLLSSSANDFSLHCHHSDNFQPSCCYHHFFGLFDLFLLFVSLVFCCFSCDCWVLLKMVSLSYSPHKTECFFLCGKQSILGVLFVSLLIFQPFSVVFCIVAVVLFIAAFPQNLCIRER